ncbi:hypothetical protein TSAR_001377 [Trichomalopsis sarcophagae]|uniref:Uncharacterized protein n=1 Tax=Trichomalopsis sarcophagae TaxID=543379 RepID=A0A232ETD1_9HYME|nr:hypothetical protein TSAR_001377 [Trichomalopsis sarcophagae]
MRPTKLKLHASVISKTKFRCGFFFESFIIILYPKYVMDRTVGLVLNGHILSSPAHANAVALWCFSDNRLYFFFISI